MSPEPTLSVQIQFEAIGERLHPYSSRVISARLASCRRRYGVFMQRAFSLQQRLMFLRAVGTVDSPATRETRAPQVDHQHRVEVANEGATDQNGRHHNVEKS